MLGQDVYDAIGKGIAEHTGLKSYKPAWKQSAGGSGFASTGIINNAGSSNKNDPEFFIKISNLGGFDMLRAEFNGVKDMFESDTIRVPEPICIGTTDANSYVVFEKLKMGGRGDAAAAGRDLARLHKTTSPNGKYGWRMANTCGATPQPNPWTDSWPEFWDSHRLGHILDLAKRDGGVFPRENELRLKVLQVLRIHEREHGISPSLCHGDLWAGNQAYASDGKFCIFDPATYYGDREVDLAMTLLFGANSPAFYEAYDQEFPLPPGVEERRVIYNLYHILNHYVLFGGGYQQQANGMIDRILSN
jgi:fructosamine-3-kinase